MPFQHIQENNHFGLTVDLNTGEVAGALPVANGGTGAVDAATARTNLGVSGNADVATLSNKSFDTVPAVKAGNSSGNLAKAGGVIYQTTTQVNNSGAAETDLWSQAIAASILNTNGDSIRFFFAGSVQTSINSKQLKVKWGATTLYDSAAQNPALLTTWTLEGWIIRTGATTQKCSARLSTTGGNLFTFTGYSTAAETLSGAVTLKVTGQGGASNEITFEMGKIIWEPAP